MLLTLSISTRQWYTKVNVTFFPPRSFREPNRHNPPIRTQYFTRLFGQKILSVVATIKTSASVMCEMPKSLSFSSSACRVCL